MVKEGEMCFVAKRAGGCFCFDGAARRDLRDLGRLSWITG